MKLVILYVQYKPKSYTGSFEQLKSYVDKIPFCKKQYFIIDNEYEGDVVQEIGNEVSKIGGDNSSWEFSGWQKGLDFLNAQKIEYDLVLLCNNAFLMNDGSSLLERYAARAAYLSYFLQSVVGRADSYGKEFQIESHKMKSWVCTNSFFIPRRFIQKIKSVITFNSHDMERFLPVEYNSGEIFLKEAAISQWYMDKALIEWLTKNWHGSFSLSNNTWDIFSRKVHSILNEVVLTARLRESGARVLDYRWPNIIGLLR
jgi:hypothetical protein